MLINTVKRDITIQKWSFDSTRSDIFDFKICTKIIGFQDIIHRATAYFILVNTLFKIGKENQYVTFTEHKGEDFHLIEKYLADWVVNDKPLSD